MNAAQRERQDVAAMRVMLFGANTEGLVREIGQYENLKIVDDTPDVIVCYGGDGTLLDAELLWPSLPKVPILNSRRGRRCIPHPAPEVIERLAHGDLVSNPYTKIACRVYPHGGRPPIGPLVALNEFNCHMDRINSAVRFQLWLNGDPYDNGVEIIGDGFVVCTPFGSTAYFSQITRGLFTRGIGIAFKAVSEHIDHLIIPEEVEIRIQITRGPAVLALDSSTDYIQLEEEDELVVVNHKPGTTILTCGPLKRLDEPF